MVARQSSPSNKPVIFDVPAAKEDKIIDLCEIDLSPGTVTVSYTHLTLPTTVRV